MRVLVALASSEAELHRARRHLGYERLVAVVPRRRPESLDAALRELGARVVEAPEFDPLGCLEAMEGLLDEALAARPKPEVRVAADGGTAAMSEGAFLACLSRGVEAWFLMHKAVRLPVLRARPVERRLSDDQAAVLRALREPRPLDELAREAGLPAERAKAAVYQLRKLGAVRADAREAGATGLGRYYQRAMGAA